MRTIELDQPGPMLDAVYAQVIVPSFPPAELCSVEGMRQTVPAGVTSISAVVDDVGLPVAAAVGDWSERSRVQLLSYLAVLPAHRGTGIGGRLLAHVLDRWRDRYEPCAIVAEIEDQAHHDTSEAHGDPAARVRFYARHGAVALDLPYFQPALSPRTGRYHDMFLILLHPSSVAAEQIREFMTEYLEMTEGGVPDDPAAVALFAAIDRPQGIPTRPL